MQDLIAENLEFLYGESTALEILPRLDEIVRRRADSIHAAHGNKKESALSEKDVLLITYADQVREAGEPPLRTLTHILDTHPASIVSGVHLLPFYPYSSDDGFSILDYLAVDPTLGTWDDIARLGNRFDLMFDAVINHVSAQSRWFERFLEDDPIYRDYFITVDGDPDLSQVMRPRALPLLTEFQTARGKRKVWTTFSADQIDLNYRNPDVLLKMLDVLLFYVEQGARYIRLDAVAYLWKEIGTPCIHLPQTHVIIRLIRAVLDEVAPWVMLITETNVPQPENVSYFGDGANEAQLVYNFALPPLVVHTFHTGNVTALSRWAQALAAPSDRVTFFNFLASHDGIGLNPARGILSDGEIDALVAHTQKQGGLVSYKQNADGTRSPYELNVNYLDALSSPNESIETQVSRFIAAQAIMLSLIGIPGIYFHSLFGSRGDRAGAETSGQPRRINRQKLACSDLERDLADFKSLRAQVFKRYAELLRVRRAHRAFHPNGLQHVFPCDEHVFALLRVAPDESERVLCLHNVANTTVTVRLSRHKVGEQWRDLSSGKTHTVDADDVFVFELQPYQMVWALGLEQRDGGTGEQKLEELSEGENAISRVNQSREEARSTYDRISRWYDLLEGGWERKLTDIALRRLEIKEGERALEIGVGTGHSLVALARSVGDSGKAYGVDLSEGMLNVTQSRINKAGLAGRVELRQGDAVALPFSADWFDAVFVSFTLELFDTPDIPVVLQECRRVLRNSGRIAVVSLSKAGGPSRMRELYEWGHLRFPNLLDCRPIYVQRALEEAGFQIAEATRSSLWGLPVEQVAATKG